MRLTKGSKVEVRSHREDKTGSWICAEILSWNGCTYTVRYQSLRSRDEGVVEKVPKNAIRPCPPPMVVSQNWVPGALVEVFHNQSWKTAKVIKAMECGKLSVRLLETSNEFTAHRSRLRIRQCWQDGKWFALGCVVDDCSHVPEMDSTRSLKRRVSPHISCYLEATKRLRVMENDDTNQQPVPSDLFKVAQKVDAFVSSDKKMGENYMRFPMSTNTNRFSHVFTGGSDDDSVLESPMAVDTVSCSSSVGSCSANGSYRNISYGSITHLRNKLDLEDYNSDAESSFGGRYEEGIPTSDESRIVDHSSELHAYRSVLEALYASGPMSWDDQEKMMDLRNALNISDDEHLLEIRNLISAKTSLLVR